MCLNSQHHPYILLTPRYNWNAQEISKHTQTQEIIAHLKDKNQKHVSKHKPIPFMSLWFIKKRSQARVSPFKGTSTQTIYRHLLKIDFYEEKNSCIAPTGQTRKINLSRLQTRQCLLSNSWNQGNPPQVWNFEGNCWPHDLRSLPTTCFGEIILLLRSSKMISPNYRSKKGSERKAAERPEKACVTFRWAALWKKAYQTEVEEHLKEAWDYQ